MKLRCDYKFCPGYDYKGGEYKGRSCYYEPGCWRGWLATIITVLKSMRPI